MSSSSLATRFGKLSCCVAVASLMIAAADDPVASNKKVDIPKLIALHNEARAEAKLEPLTSNPKLEAAAKVQAKDQADRGKMDHIGGDGSTVAERVERQEYRYQSLGENVAMGQKTSKEVYDAWMDSPPHKKNMLGNFTEIGAACYIADDGTSFWCVTFGTPWPEIKPEAAALTMLEAVNAARAEADLPAVKTHAKLEAAAKIHAKDMAEAGKFLLEDADGEVPTTRAQKSGYAARAIAQDDAIGQTDPKKAVKGWLDDEHSKKTILGDYDHIGVGIATDAKGVPYWTVLLAKPKG